MRISDWSSDVCSSDLVKRRHTGTVLEGMVRVLFGAPWTAVGNNCRAAIFAAPGSQIRKLQPCNFNGQTMSKPTRGQDSPGQEARTRSKSQLPECCFQNLEAWTATLDFQQLVDLKAKLCNKSLHVTKTTNQITLQ